jgi:hypothetical protein
MGDYYWYACEGHKDANIAARYYADAAKKNDPQVSNVISRTCLTLEMTPGERSDMLYVFTFVCKC